MQEKNKEKHTKVHLASLRNNSTEYCIFDYFKNKGQSVCYVYNSNSRSCVIQQG